MKNLKYFPFERNRYFYGKLLTVDDFETEQKYMNDKRRMGNRFLHGCGVAAGFHVVAVDERTISVENGFALDFAGREIVLDEPVIKKLALFEGFEEMMEEEEEELSYLYLCLEYGEREVDAVHNMTGMSSQADNKAEYSKYKEGCRIFLSNQEPEQGGAGIGNLYKSETTVFWQEGVRITQSVAKYAMSSGTIEVDILVEKLGEQNPISFSYEAVLNCLTYEGRNRLLVAFSETDYEKATRYELHYTLEASAVNGVKGSIEAASDSFSMKIGDNPIFAKIQGRSYVQIMQESPEQQMLDTYYKSAMENIIKHTYQQSIYLARISVIKAGEVYVIENIENMPFRQYVHNNVLASATSRIFSKELREIKKELSALEQERKPIGEYEKRTEETGMEFATGMVTISLGIGGKEGQCFFSEEIVHGLGTGNVFLRLGMEETKGKKAIYGLAEIFGEQRENEVLADVAAKADLERGSFVIGAKLKQTTACNEMKVHWMAVKDKRREAQEEKRKLFIEPNMLYVKVRESIYLKAECKNMRDKRVKWSLQEEESGTIDQNGLYTAPNQGGVYGVFVQSAAHPELKATAYIIVREE